MLTDILMVILWCFAVYVCAYDWEDMRDPGGGDINVTTFCGKEKDKAGAE